MAENNNIVTRITLDGVQAFKNGINSVKMSLSDFGRNAVEASKKSKEFSEKMEAIGSFGGALAVGAGAVSAGLLLVGKSALKSAGDMEQMRMALDVMLGDSSKSRSLLKELEKFAARTPLEFAPVVQMAQQLMSVNTPIQNIIPTLEAIGNLAKGNAQDTENMVDAYMKMTAKNRVLQEEVNRFTERGVPILAEMAKVMGLNANETDKVIKMMEKGQVSVTTFDKAMSNLTGTGGQFAGMMDKQSKTLQGLMSTLSSDFQQLQTELMTGLLPIFKRVASFLDILVQKFRGLSPETKALVSYVLLGVTAFTSLATIFGGILFVIPNIVSGFTLIAGALGVTKLALSGLALGIPTLITAIIAIATNWDTVTRVWRSSINNINTAMAEMSLKIMKFLNEIIGAYNKFAKQIKGIPVVAEFDTSVAEKNIKNLEAQKKELSKSSESKIKIKETKINEGVIGSGKQNTISGNTKENKENEFDNAMKRYEELVARQRVLTSETTAFQLQKLDEVVASHATTEEQKYQLRMTKLGLQAQIEEQKRQADIQKQNEDFNFAVAEHERWLEMESIYRDVSYSEELNHYNRIVAAKAVTEDQKRKLEADTHQMYTKNYQRQLATVSTMMDVMTQAFMQKDKNVVKSALNSTKTILLDFVDKKAKEILATKIAEVAKATAQAPLSFGATLLAIAPIVAAYAAGMALLRSIQFADGGMVKATNGGIFANIGEAGKDEAVVPLDDPQTIQRIQRTVGVSQSSGSREVIILDSDGSTMLAKGMYYKQQELLQKGAL